MASEERKELPARSTRGKKLSALIDQEEAQADETFWGQDFFKEEAGDNEYESEPEEEDVVDADFDDPRNEVVEPIEGLDADKEEKVKKKANVYVDPKGKKALQRAKKKKEREEAEEYMEEPEDEKDDEEEEEEPRPKRRKVETPVADREVRASTKSKTKDTEWNQKREKKETERRRAERVKKRPRTVMKRLTQEDLLREAKITEEYNKESLAQMLKLEEEKKKIPVTKVQHKGPRIIFHSKDGKSSVTFTEVTAVPEFINSRAPAYPKIPLCEITGLPAKYLDPKTSKYYATAAAFKVIRENFVQKVEEKYDERISQLQVQLEEKKKKKVELSKAKREEGMANPVAPIQIQPQPMLQ